MNEIVLFFSLLLCSEAGTLFPIKMECSDTSTYNPNTAVQLCSSLPWRFIDCVPYFRPKDGRQDLLGVKEGITGNFSSSSSGFKECNDEDGQGFVKCRTLEGISCFGPREFLRFDTTGRWCLAEKRLRIGTKSFPTAVVIAASAGWIGADRFYLGYIGIGILKLLTVGGVGVWWLIDLFLLCTGSLGPADNVPWEDTW